MADLPFDPNDIEALERHLKALKRAKSRDAGTVVRGSVKTEGGDFVCGDLVQVIVRATPDGRDATEARSIVSHYLQALAHDLALLRTNEIAPTNESGRAASLELPDVFVPLNTTLMVDGKQTLADALETSPSKRGVDPAIDLMRSRGELRPVTLREALCEFRTLTVLGAAGSGKSTFGASVLLDHAKAWNAPKTQRAKVLGKDWKHGLRLPIRVVLRQFAQTLPAGDAPATAGDLWAYIGQECQATAKGLSGRVLEVLQTVAREQGAMFVLDGLDECGDETRRRRVRAAVDGLVASAGAACRFVLTARPYAWPEGPEPHGGVFAIDALNDGQVEAFVTRWYDAKVRRGWSTQAEAEAKRDELLAVWRRPDLEPLARSPLLLTRMAILHHSAPLPDDRADLYDKSVDLLLQVWTQRSGSDKALLDDLGEPRPKMSDLRAVLAQVAFEVHEAAGLAQGAADISQGRLLRAFKPLLGSLDKAQRVVDFIEARAGLLIGQGERGGELQFCFPHRTFQEYLAATHLATLADFEDRCAQLARGGPGHWDVVLPLAARQAQLVRGCNAAAGLIKGRSFAESTGKPTPADWRASYLAGAMLHELGGALVGSRDDTRATLDRVRSWLVALLPMHPSDQGLPAPERVRAATLLGALGDPRFDPGRWHLPAEPMLGFVLVPADPDFRIGTSAASVAPHPQVLGEDTRVREINDERTPTLKFWIGRHLVTVAQYRAYVDATGCQPADADALRRPGTEPMSRVSWTEARAYARWLGQQISPRWPNVLRELELERIDGDLPSELEWEKAARGGLVGRLFPWGDDKDPERANYADSGVFGPSAVGCFAANGYGIHDMVGNLWEWTATEYAEPVGQAAGIVATLSSERPMVVRGGAWHNDADNARCAFRLRSLLGNRVDGLGFRVVLRSSPVSKSRPPARRTRER